MKLLLKDPFLKTICAGWLIALLTAGCASHFNPLAKDPLVLATPVVLDIEAPEAVAFDAEGTLYVTSSEENGSILKIGTDGVKKVLSRDLMQPVSLLFDPTGNLYTSIRMEKGKVLKINPDGSTQKILEDLPWPEGLAFDEKGVLFIALNIPDGKILQLQNDKLKLYADGLVSPEKLTLDLKGNLYVTEMGQGQVTKIDLAGKKENFMFSVSQPESITYCDNYQGIFVSENNEKGKIFFAGLDGKTSIITSKLLFPQGMACDQHGNLWVAEKGKNQILILNTTDIAVHLSEKVLKKNSAKR